METVVIDGIKTRYEVSGSGPALLMYSPGGFDSSLANWSSFSFYKRLNLLQHLSKGYTCITFDRRESGESGGRVEIIAWSDYVAQGLGLLDHLGIDKAHLMGGCVGCSSVAEFAVSYPERVMSMVMFSPAGGPKYRINQHARLNRHAAFAAENGLAGVMELALSHEKGFSQDPRIGPWASVIRKDPIFARNYASFDSETYQTIVVGMARKLFDKDTVPGPQPEQMMSLTIPSLIVPGQDSSHAPSAARYLEECLKGSQYWDVPVADQTEQTINPKILEFLGSIR